MTASLFFPHRGTIPPHSCRKLAMRIPLFPPTLLPPTLKLSSGDHRPSGQVGLDGRGRFWERGGMWPSGLQASWTRSFVFPTALDPYPPPAFLYIPILFLPSYTHDAPDSFLPVFPWCLFFHHCSLSSWHQFHSPLLSSSSLHFISLVAKLASF